MSPGSVGRTLRQASLFCLTWPYNRALYHRTISPTKRLLASKSLEELRESIAHWVDIKGRELHDVNTGATVCLAITVGIFSWPSIGTATWYTRGLWYGDFILAILALIATSQENILLDEMLPNKSRHEDTSINQSPPYFSPENSKQRSARLTQKGHRNVSMTNVELKQTLAHILRPNRLQTPTQTKETGNLDGEWETLEAWLKCCRPDKVMLFIWQTPLMLMSWSWVTFITALTLHMMRPFIEKNAWSDDSKVAIMFLIFLGPGLALFVLSAYLPYVRSKSEEEDDVDEVKSVQSMTSRQSIELQMQKPGLAAGAFPTALLSRTSSISLSQANTAGAIHGSETV